MGRPKTEAATYKSLMLRLPTEVLEACKVRATIAHRSLNAQLLSVIEDWLEEPMPKRKHVYTSATKD